MQKSSRKAILTALSTTLSAALLFQPVAVHAAVSSAASPKILSGSLTNGITARISPRLDTTSSQPIKVIVQLDGASIAEGNYAAKMGVNSLSAEATESSINRQHKSFLASAKSSGISLNVTFQYDTVLNGMEVELPANQIPKLAKIQGVKSIYENRTFYEVPVTASTSQSVAQAVYDINPLKQIGVPDAWEQGLTGKGIKVGIIDSGIDYLHPDLKDAYKGGYNVSFNTNDPYEEAPDASTGNQGTNHGTHVSGTIAGRAQNTTDIVQKGIAYESDLYMYKVLKYDIQTGKSSGSTAEVIDGIEHAVKDGMDVINLSLGSDDAKDPFTPDAIAINNTVLAGVVAVIANGNNATDSEQYYYSMGSPASSQLAISVGAATSPSSSYSAVVNTSILNNQQTVTGSVYDLELPVISWHIGQENFDSIIGTGPQDVVYVNLGADSDYTGKDVTGKTVLLSRGTLNFADKFRIAKEHGAKAVVIFNGNATADGKAILDESIPGRDTSIGNFYGAGFTVPIIEIDAKPGRALARIALGNPGSSISFDFSSFPAEADPGDHMADFSSRGPNADGILGIKPDFVAPGVAILSTLPEYGKYINNGQYPAGLYDEAYVRNSGTSMATPHVAGLSALLKQEHPNWTPFDIRAALANTADPIADEEGNLYDVYSQGAGRVNVAKAIETPALLQTVEELTLYNKEMNPVSVTNYGDNASFGIMEAGSTTKTIQLQVNNTSDKAVTYKASYQLHSSVTSDPANPIATPDTSKINVSLSGLNDEFISAAANSKQSFDLNVAPAADAANGVYEGDVVLTAEDLPTLHIPFVVHVGEGTSNEQYTIQDLKVSNLQLSPNGDGNNDSIDVSFTLGGKNTDYFEVGIVDINDEFVGLIDFKDLTAENKFLDKKQYLYHFDGTYFDPNTTEQGSLEDGQYQIYVYAANSKVTPVEEHESYVSFAVAHNPSTPTPSPSASPDSSYPPYTGPIIVPTPSPTTTPAPTSSPSGSALSAILGQGQQQAAVKSTTKSEDSATVTTVASDDLQAAIGTGGTKLALVINAAAEVGKASKLSLTPDQIQLLKTAPAGSSLYLTTSKEAIELPLSILASVASGNGIELVIKPAADQAVKFNDVNVIGTPVTFELSTVNGTNIKELPIPAAAYFKRSFTLDKGISADKAGVLFLENGKVAPAPAVFSVNADGTTTVTVNRPGFSTYAVAKKAVSFQDISSSWAQSRIQSLAEKLLINGTSATSFSPSKSVTRAEFAAMLSRGLGLSAAAPAPFSDLKAGAWYTDAVSAAYAAGLINGYNDGTFRPDGIISRQELSVMLAKAAALLNIQPSTGSIHTYADSASFSNFAKDSISAVTAAGLMEGSTVNGSTLFQPLEPTTRAAAATVIHKLLQAGKLI